MGRESNVVLKKKNSLKQQFSGCLPEKNLTLGSRQATGYHVVSVTINKLGFLEGWFVCSPVGESAVETVASRLEGGHLICLDSMTSKFLSSWVHN